MGRGITFSLALHGLVIVILLITATFGTKAKINPDEVVRVSLASLPGKPDLPAKVETPQSTQPKPAETKPLPVEPPKQTSKKVVTEKPKTKPKQSKEKPVEKQESNTKSDSDSPQEKPIESQSTGEGSSFRGATVDNASFNYNWWFDQAFYKLNSNFRNTVPYDGKLVCVVYFQVLKSGRVFDLKVKETSGIGEFDDVCLNAVEQSSPFPPLPRDFVDEVIGITVPFTYQPE